MENLEATNQINYIFQDPIVIFGLIVIGVGLLVILFCFYILFRNNKVCDYRIKIICEKGPDIYSKLPDYGYMLNHFWVWPLDKFLKKEDRK